MRPIVISKHDEDDPAGTIVRARELFIVEREARWRIWARRRLLVAAPRANDRVRVRARSGW